MASNEFKINLVGTPRDLDTVGKSAIGRDVLGRPFFMDVIIDGLRLPNEPLISFTKQKRIIETVLTGEGRKGTVKEHIQSGDYLIKITGVCLGDRQYPQKEVEQITQKCESSASLEIENSIADMLGVRNIAIKGYGFPAMQGRPYSQEYYINAVSDEDFYAFVKFNNL